MREVEIELRQSERVKGLCEALASLTQDEELLLKFLRDLLSYGELKDAANRYAAARLLHEGYSVRQTAAELNMAVASVDRVRQWVVNGTGGYVAVLRRFDKDHNRLV